MDLIFCTEGRFIRHSEDLVYSVDGSLTNILWKRYLTKFDHIYVMARVLSDSELTVNEKYLASNERVSFIDLPYYVGPLQYLKVKCGLKRKIRENLRTDCVYICRVPGEIGNQVSSYLRKQNIPYGVEVVGDPWDVFASGAVKHPLRIYFRYRGAYYLKKVVSKAKAALYVTERQLQSRYPISSSAFQLSASNVQIRNENLPIIAKRFYEKASYSLLSIGSLEQMYKAPDVVLKALSILKGRGVHCNLTWLGEGKYKREMEELASVLQVDKEVCFKGNVARDKVDEELAKADLFLLVSRTEGLPRAIIEAMAMGLPCVGTRVGGIPELLDEQALIPKDDALALANKIEYMINYWDFTNSLAKRNFEEAKKYYDETLRKRREEFYEYLISITQ